MLPTVFISHGSPMVLLDDDAFTQALARLATETGRPAAVVVVSAHWQEPMPLRITASEHPPQMHDFYGFPPALYRLPYAPPGDPALARELAARCAAAGHPAVLDDTRGLDHGTWVPLRFAFPRAELPVVQVSLPSNVPPRDLYAIGAALAPLRNRDVLVVGSGGIVHNLRRVHFAERDAPVDVWARQFDTWVEERLAASDVESLLDYARRARHADLAVPTTEHFDPLFVVLGASGKQARVTGLHASFQYGNLSMRTFLRAAD